MEQILVMENDRGACARAVEVVGRADPGQHLAFAGRGRPPRRCRRPSRPGLDGLEGAARDVLLQLEVERGAHDRAVGARRRTRRRAAPARASTACRASRGRSPRGGTRRASICRSASSCSSLVITPIARRLAGSASRADRAGAAGRGERVHARRRLRDRGEEGDLGPAQVLDRLVEVAAGGVGDAVDAVAVGDDAQVVGEDGLAPVAGGHEERGERLDRLARVGGGPGCCMRATCMASVDAPETRRPRAQVLAQRAHDGERVDPGVAPEAAVLDRDRGRGDALGHALERPVAAARRRCRRRPRPGSARAGRAGAAWARGRRGASASRRARATPRRSPHSRRWRRPAPACRAAGGRARALGSARRRPRTPLTRLLRRALHHDPRPRASFPRPRRRTSSRPGPAAG